MSLIPTKIMPFCPIQNLLQSVRRGDVDSVRKTIEKYGLSHSASWSNGYNLLREAIEKKQSAVAKLLLTYDSKVNSKSKKSTDTPLHLAVKNNDLEMVEMLLEKHANIHAKDGTGETPLHCAVSKGNLEIVKSLLKKRPCIDMKSFRGRTALHLAAESGHDKIAEILLYHGAYINSACLTSWKEGFTPLHYASLHGHENLVKLLLRHGADVNAITKEDFTPLHVATEMGHEKIVRLLLEHEGSDINARDKNWRTILHIAIEKGTLNMVKNVLPFCHRLTNENSRNCLRAAVCGPNNEKYCKVVEILLKYGFAFNRSDNDNPFLLHAAVEKGYLKIIEDLLKYRADVNSVHPTKKGYTLLHNAAEKKQLEAAKLLLNNNADVNAITYDRKLPILYAIENIDVNMVKLLLAHRADIKGRYELLHTALRKESIEIVKILLERDPEIDMNARDVFGSTALHHAVHKNDHEHAKVSRGMTTFHRKNNVKAKYDLVKLCLSRGAKVNALTNEGMSPLYAAVEAGHPKIVEILLDYNADVNCVTDYEMKTALHYSVMKGDETISKMLLDKGANVNVKGKYGRTPLYVACENKHINIVMILFKYGADIDSQDVDSVSPLQISAKYDSPDIVLFLLKNFADVELRDNYGKTALHVAAQHGCPEIVEILLDHGANINVTCKKGHTAFHYAASGAGDIYDHRHNNRLYGFVQHCGHDLEDDDYFNYYNYRNEWEDNSVLDHDDYSDYSGDDTDIDGACRSDEVLEVLEQHILQIRALNLYVSDKNCDMVDFDNEHKEFYDDCQREIQGMKNCKINDTNVSYHDLLTKDRNQHAHYARNKIIAETMALKEYVVTFPIYSNLICNNFKRGQKRESLLNSGFKALNLLSGFVLPELSLLEVFRHLSNKDLENLIKSSHECDINESIA